MQKLLVAALFFAALHAHSADDEIDKAAITGAYTRAPYRNKTFEPVGEPSPLKVKESLADTDKEIARLAESAFRSSPHNLGMMLIDKNQIIYERYAEGLDEKTKYFSYSMGKSLTAYAVGQAHCGGSIASLDDKAVAYAKNLEGTVFGDASVKQLLTMSSGAPAPFEAGGSAQGEWRSVTRQMSTIEQVLRSYGKTPVEERPFEYNNSDTNALMYVLKGAGGFHQIFDEKIWKPAKPKSQGAWLIDKNGDAYAAAGFSATLSDWGRLSTLVLNMRSGKEGVCIEKFMKDATSIQKKVSKGYFGDDYGYQTWIYSRQPSSRFTWRGAYGQMVAFDPVKERVLIVFRHRSFGAAGQAIGGLMARWERMP